MGKKVGLVEAIETLRSELTDAMKAAEQADDDIQLEVGEITLQFQIQVERSAEGKAGVSFWLIDLESSASKSSAITHTVTIPLTPRLNDGSPIRTGGSLRDG